MSSVQEVWERREIVGKERSGQLWVAHKDIQIVSKQGDGVLLHPKLNVVFILHMGVGEAPLCNEDKELSWGMGRKCAGMLAEIKYRKSQ